MRYKSKLFSFLLAVAAVGGILQLPLSSQASIFRHDSTVQVSNIEAINDDYYVYANRLMMDGVINGDLCAFCYKIDVRGEVGQTANLFAQGVKMEGKVNGSLRVFCQQATIDGYVARSAVLAAEDIEVGKNSVIERDLSAYGALVSLEGTVKGNVKASCGNFDLTGVIVGNAEIEADHITISPPAVITGNLIYTSKNKADIELDKGVTITGTTTWNLPAQKEEEESGQHRGLTAFVVRISSLLAAFIFGLVVARVFRPYAEESFNQLRTRFTTTIAAGLLGILVLVLCVIVLLVSLGAMLAGYVIIKSGLAPIGSLVMIFSILMVPVTSFATVTGAIVLYSGKILCGFALGHLIMSRARPGTALLGSSGLFVGLVILSLLFAIPYAGWVLYIAACVIGAGAILLGIKYCRKSIWQESVSLPPAGGPLDTQGQA